MMLILLLFISLQSVLSYKLLTKLTKNENVMKMINTNTDTYFSKFSIKQWGLFDKVILILLLMLLIK